MRELLLLPRHSPRRLDLLQRRTTMTHCMRKLYERMRARDLLTHVKTLCRLQRYRATSIASFSLVFFNAFFRILQFFISN